MFVVFSLGDFETASSHAAVNEPFFSSLYCASLFASSLEEGADTALSWRSDRCEIGSLPAEFWDANDDNYDQDGGQLLQPQYYVANLCGTALTGGGVF